MNIQEIPFALSAAGGPPAGILRQLLSSSAVPKGRPSGEVILLSSSGRGFKTYGFLLASTSPYFRKMFEQLSGPAITLITDLPQPVMIALLTWLHQGRLPVACDPILASLIAAARKYNFPSLKREAEKALLSLASDSDTMSQRTTPPLLEDSSDLLDVSTDSGIGRDSSHKKKRPSLEQVLVTLPPKKRRRYSSSSSVDSGYISDRCATPQ